MVYYEDAQASAFKKGEIPYPVQRRGDMRHFFYNILDFQALSEIQVGTLIEIKFKTKIREYILAGSQECDDCVCLVDPKQWIDFQEDLKPFFVIDEDSYHGIPYVSDSHAKKKNVLFVVNRYEVECAVEDLFTGNQHLVVGYANKTISIVKSDGVREPKQQL